MSNNSDKCACGFEASEFMSILTIINDRIGESRVYDYRLTPTIIKLHQDLIEPASDHLRKMKEFCEIEIKDEEEKLKALKRKLIQINDPKMRTELSNDSSSIIDNIKRKLYECAREK